MSEKVKKFNKHKTVRRDKLLYESHHSVSSLGKNLDIYILPGKLKEYNGVSNITVKKGTVRYKFFFVFELNIYAPVGMDATLTGVRSIRLRKPE